MKCKKCSSIQNFFRNLLTDCLNYSGLKSYISFTDFGQTTNLLKSILFENVF